MLARSWAAVDRARRGQGHTHPSARILWRSGAAQRVALGAMSGLRVLAAMSGGVDSATAAARAVDAGHEVTGVHLALSSNPSSYRTGARGCCTLEDARDARGGPPT